MAIVSGRRTSQTLLRSRLELAQHPWKALCRMSAERELAMDGGMSQQTHLLVSSSLFRNPSEVQCNILLSLAERKLTLCYATVTVKDQ